MKIFFDYGIQGVLVCAIACIQLLCVNSSLEWLASIEVGVVALVIAIMQRPSFFWMLLVGYPLVLSWYSSDPLLIQAWAFSWVACVLWLVHTFIVKEKFMSVRFGFMVLATLTWNIALWMIDSLLVAVGYIDGRTFSIGEMIITMLIQIPVHSAVLFAWMMSEYSIERIYKRYGA